MPVVSVRIPQMGEGLQEARLVELLKQPGDTIKRDDPIYVMETDKAVTDVESPYDGKLVEWTAEVNSVLPIGTEIAKMEVAEGVQEMPADHGSGGGSAAAPAPTSTAAAKPAQGSKAKRASGAVPIPPRTRKYLREKGLLDEAAQIPAAGKKLMPEDVDAYIAAGGAAAESTGATSGYSESELPADQQTLNYRIKRGAEACVAATIAVDVDWTNMAAARSLSRETTGESAFSMMLWCVVQSMKQPEFASFRSSLAANGKTLRTYEHVNLGIAVAIPGDLLRTAVVREADTMDRAQFREAVKTQIEKVRGGEDQIDATTTVTVSNIGKANVQLGIPVVVKPAVATMALGTVEDRAFPGADGKVEFRKVASLVLTFDHLIANGVGAANFLNDIRERIQSYEFEGSAVSA